jgi:hypothetical protein
LVGCNPFQSFRGGAVLIHRIKRFLGITPKVYDLPYNQKVYIITLSTAVERVR